MESLCLYLHVPICSFRPNWSREYQDTYPFPPPTTIYGMLLSLVGVDWQNKTRFAGIRLALALEGIPKTAKVFRKLRRVPQDAKSRADPLAARRPDYQDLLIDLKLWAWVCDSNRQDSLVELIKTALDPLRRAQISRYGGLSLGESSHLVDEISVRKPNGEGRFLCRVADGYYSLPVWVHHPRCGNGRTRMERFSILPPEPLAQPGEEDERWITVEP